MKSCPAGTGKSLAVGVVALFEMGETLPPRMGETLPPRMGECMLLVVE